MSFRQQMIQLQNPAFFNPEPIKLSQESINELRDYIQDEEIRVI
jgi:hypothetical protein